MHKLLGFGWIVLAATAVGCSNGNSITESTSDSGAESSSDDVSTPDTTADASGDGDSAVVDTAVDDTAIADTAVADTTDAADTTDTASDVPLDGLDSRVADTADAITCEAGASCTPTDPCKVGVFACGDGAPVCTTTGNATDGTSCGGTKVCSGGACVNCLLDTSCAAPTPACDTTAHVCVACTRDANCASTTPRCNLSTHTCVLDLLLAAGIDNTNRAFGASFAAGAWTTSTLGADYYSFSGGGVTVTAARTGLAVFRSNAGAAIGAATFGTSWSTLAAEGVTTNVIGMPTPGGAGAFIAFQNGTVSEAEFHDTGATWSPTAATTSAASDNNSLPAIATIASGDPLVLFPGQGATLSTHFAWSLRTAGTWSAAAAIPGSTKPSFLPAPAITAVKRVGADQVVAVMNSTTSGEIDYAVFSGGTWSTAASVVTNAANGGQSRVFALAPLPDGRVALVYIDTAQVMHVAFFDGTSWGSFQIVPGTGSKYSRFPIAIARGANASAVLEVLYTDGVSDSRIPRHVRLTNESTWTWTSPLSVGSAATDSVYIAVGP